ncbi:MAG: hypothetical protein WC639_04965 [Patescibacteria group bacterium]|jgi:hypothetical protein
MKEETTETGEITAEDKKREAERGALLHRLLGSKVKGEGNTILNISLCL